MSERLYLTLKSIAGTFDFCMACMVVELGMCVIVSFFILEAVLVMRRTILKDNVFAKGMLWSVLALVPFVGKLKLFYTNIYVGRPFIMWLTLCNKIRAVRYVYVLGMLISALWMVHENRVVGKVVSAAGTWKYRGDTLYISELAISPFVTGVISPKIVLPEMIIEKLDINELDTVILHEKTHIRLKHLWVYAIWNVVCCLLWPNVCLFLSTARLKEDMEDICDKVTIKRSGIEALEYGRLIIKSASLISTEINALPAAFNGEESFQAAKRRIMRIRDYVPYKIRKTVMLGSFFVCFLVVAFALVKTGSYPKYTELKEISLLDKNFNIVKTGTAEELSEVLMIYDKEIIVNNDAIMEIYPDINCDDWFCYISWGGFMKFPGAGGGGNAAWIEELSEGDVTSIPYTDMGEDIFVKIAKWLF